MMRGDIDTQVKAALERDYAFVQRGAWLQKGRCPQCGKKELYARADRPRVVSCGRKDKCGWEAPVKELFPDIFEEWSKRYVATEVDPDAAADAYLLHERGFDLQHLRGSYAQETFADRARNISSATVRFPLPGGGWWERLIDHVARFDRKARFAPGKSYAGHWWQHPGTTIEQLAAADEIWIVEGIFDSIALIQGAFDAVPGSARDRRAVSIMSCYNYPEHALQQLRAAIAAGASPAKQPRLIWALDIGAAGTEYTRKFVARARKEGWTCGAAQVRLEDDPGRKADWNDLHLADRLGPDALAEYRWHGEVLIAATAADKACLIAEHRGARSFPFVFDSRTYWARVAAEEADEKVSEYILACKKLLQQPDPEKLAELEREAARESVRVEEIANCAFRALYFQRDEATDESAYHFRVDFPRDRPHVKGGFTGNAVATSAEFKKRLISIAPGAIWTGDQAQLDRLMQRQLAGIKTVEAIEFTGYSRDHGAYVFGGLAVKDGKLYRPNDDDYFDFGKVAVKLKSAERILDIDYDPEGLDLSWLPVLTTAFGTRGLVVLTFWIASFFAEQVRRDRKSFPFLELVGPPDSGKTTLVEFLWKLAGRENYEGIDPAKATAAALARNLGKVANLPVVLIEGDRRDDVSHARKFEWDELKTAYNGRSVRARGVKSSGMETFEPPFRGAILIEQNDPVNASRPILERILHIEIDKTGWSPATKQAAEAMEGWAIEKLSGFIVHAALREKRVLDRANATFAGHDALLLAMPGIRTQRLAKTHAQLLSMLDALCELLPITAEQHHAAAAYITHMALDRQLAVNSDHPAVEWFWERFDWLELNQGDPLGSPINHSRDPEKLIAVSLVEFEQRCADRHLRLEYPMADLKKHLKTSKARRFLDAKNVNSVTSRVLHCWVFEQPGAARAQPSRDITR